MAQTTLKVGPLTRVEGHLEIEVTVDTVGGVQQVVDAKAAGMMFRGFEKILAGRDPRDATHYTQRICGVCPISHGMASSLALESAFGIQAPDNGRIVRNLVLGANFVQSHILHLYHLAAPDYIDTTGILDMSPWTPRYVSPDMAATSSIASRLVTNYVTALGMRRTAHEMGAVFGAKLPCSPVLVAGGATSTVTSAKVTNYRRLLTQLRSFIDNTVLPDFTEVGTLFPQYWQLGKGCGNLLAYGVFDQNAAGTQKFLARGRLTNGTLGTVDTTQIKEYVKYSWYSSASGLTPVMGDTTPSATKAGAYSWIKAPRYMSLPHEVGPLARMWVNGDYRKGISVMDRLTARALELKKVADGLDTWLNQLASGGSVYTQAATPKASGGMGLTEAPRGALGHWMEINNWKISKYQFVTPTGWNASPRDDSGVRGPIEQALLGVPVRDMAAPVELLRVVHSFDPCLSCAVHMVRPGKSEGVKVVI